MPQTVKRMSAFRPGRTPLFVLLVGIPVGIGFVIFPHAVVNDLVLGAAVLCFAASAVSVAEWARGAIQPNGPGDMVRHSLNLALVSGVIAGTLLAVVLGVRTIYALIELIAVLPVFGARDFGFGAAGAYGLVLLWTTNLIVFVVRRDPRLSQSLLILSIMIAAWPCLTLPGIHLTTADGLTRTVGPTALMLSLAAVAFLASVFQPRSGVPAADQVESLQTLYSDRRGQGDDAYRAIWLSTLVLVLLLACYHLAAPLAVWSLGIRLPILMAATACGLGAAASWLDFRRSGRSASATVGLGLGSAFVAAVCVAMPAHYPTALVDRYPGTLQAAMIGWAVSSVFGTLLVEWSQQRLPSSGERDVPGHGSTRTRMTTLSLTARRNAFVCGTLAVTVAGLVALWPALAGIGTADAGGGRFPAGVAANLLVLLSLMWSARRLKRPSLYGLTALAGIATIGFILVRLMPYTHQFG